MIIRPIQSTDYKEVERIIKKALLETVSKDYSKPAIDLMLASDPTQPWKTRREREYFVATDNKAILGIIGRKDNMVKTLFVDPSYHGKGVGTSLISYIEKLIITDGYTVSTLNSTISAKSFYEKQGYKLISEEKKEVEGNVMIKYAMEKKLRKK